MQTAAISTVKHFLIESKYEVFVNFLNCSLFSCIVNLMVVLYVNNDHLGVIEKCTLFHIHFQFINSLPFIRFCCVFL